MEVVFLIGRILFAAIFINSGIAHFKNSEAMGQYADAKGAPGGANGVIATGAMILAGGISILLGLWADVGAILIVAFLVPTSYFMHDFWKAEDPQQAQTEQAQFFKNVALAGAALVILYLYWALGDAADLSLTGPLFIK